MKIINTIFISVILLSSVETNAQGVNIDTIKLNKNLAATIEFSENIKYSHIGNNPYRMLDENIKDYKYYQISELDNILLIETKEPKKEISSITIKTKNNVYYGKIGYFDEIEKSFYSFIDTNEIKNNERNNVLKKEESIKTKDNLWLDENETEVFNKSKEIITSETIKRRINEVLKLENDYDNIADIKGDVIFQVANIVNDDKYTYIKTIIQNNSASTYIINGVLFKFEEGKKGFKKKEVVNKEWINPKKILYPQDKKISSYSFENIGFVIPMYNGTNGELLIKIMESEGTRTAVIKVKSKIINNTKIF